MYVATRMMARPVAGLVVLMLLPNCGGAAEPPPLQPQWVGPTPDERRFYQAGFDDGRAREAEAARIVLGTKDAEIAALRLRVTQVERDAAATNATRAADSTALQSCETELQKVRGQQTSVESSSTTRSGADASSARGADRDTSEAPASTPCCKVCRAGKACGNSCISRAKECHKGTGCACDG